MGLNESLDVCQVCWEAQSLGEGVLKEIRKRDAESSD